MSPQAPPRVAVVGGSGFFGRRVVEDLLAFGGLAVRVISRHGPPEPTPDPGPLEARRADQTNPDELAAALEGVAAVVHTAGPYRNLHPTVAKTAIDLGLPYVDLADAREFYRRLAELDPAARAAGVTLAAGASAVPGLSGVFARAGARELERVDSIRSVIAPGTRGSRGGATFDTLLAAAGRRLAVPDLAGTRPGWGWSEPEWFGFPPPVGRRLTYLALDSPEVDLFPAAFGARRVEFRAGSEFPWLNRALAGLARLRRRLGRPRLERWERLARPAVGAVGRFGTEAGGLMVELRGRGEGAARRLRYAVVSGDRGADLPALPASILAAAAVRGEGPPPGLAAPWTWLTPERFARELVRRGAGVLASREDEPWAPWPPGDDHRVSSAAPPAPWNSTAPTATSPPNSSSSS